MQAAEFIKFVHHPQLLDEDSLQQLQKITADFPYFQSAHILLSMASRKWDASVYQQSLKKTAITVANRAHLFRLIHQVENEMAGSLPEEVPTVSEEKAPDVREENTKQELDILKAAEISVENAPEVIKEKEEIKPEPKVQLPPEEVLEREIAKEVVNAFVEKEILKTPELNRPQEEPPAPESFADWLSYLKKNNGQPYQEIEKQVNEQKNTLAPESEPEISLKPQKEVKIPAAEPVNPAAESRKLKNKAIIDKIIESSPGLIRQKEDQRFYAPDIKAKESLLENEHLVTETLAKIYALQGSVSKAIRAYEILSIKHPQKRAYYDGLIQKLKHNG